MLQYTLGQRFYAAEHSRRWFALPRCLGVGVVMYHEKLIEAVAVPQVATFEGVILRAIEGIIPAPRIHARHSCLY